MQNYIKNFEEQESNTAIMNKLKSARVFSFWKALTQLNKKTSKQSEENQAGNLKEKDAKNPKMMESHNFVMNEDIESEYMELVVQFRKVTSSYSAKNAASPNEGMEPSQCEP